MSLARADVVDLVTLLPGSPRVTLIAYDGGEVPEAQARETALQEKLIAYLRFVVSGQFAKTYSQFLDRDLSILVVCQKQPTDGMKKVKGIGDHAHSETFLPVEIIDDAEFRKLLAKGNPKKNKLRWKFW